MKVDSNIKNWGEYSNKKVSGIYSITNIANGKIYIGQSIDLYNRNYGHTTVLKRNKEHNPHLQNAWNKYGEASFVYKPILFCEKEELERYERGLIKAYKSQDRKIGYNVTAGGKSLCGIEHPAFGKKRSAEFCKKQSICRSGKKNCFYGKGPIKAIEVSAKLSRMPIVQLNKQGNFIKEFTSITEASKEMKISKSCIWRVCKEERKTSCGYIWKYKEKNKAKILAGG